MPRSDELRYIQAYSRIIGVQEAEVLEYVGRKGITSLVDNASELLTNAVRQEKHAAFLDLYRMTATLDVRSPVITSQENAADFFRSVMHDIHDKEAFVVAFLNTKNRVVGFEIVSVGSLNQTIVHPREVFRKAIVNKAMSVIVCHNHPSGDVTPSAEDMTITRRLTEAGKLLGIEVLDHLIVSGLNRAISFSFKGNKMLEGPAVYTTTKTQPQMDR